MVESGEKWNKVVRKLLVYIFVLVQKIKLVRDLVYQSKRKDFEQCVSKKVMIYIKYMKMLE